MQFLKLEIDGFGIYRDVKIDGLNSGLIIVYAPNGAGKSTLKAFMQAMLFWDPNARTSDIRDYKPPRSNSFGGRALIRHSKYGEQLVTANFLNKQRNVSPIGSASQITTAQLSGRASAEVYRSIFSINNLNLQDGTGNSYHEISSAMGGIVIDAGTADVDEILKSIKESAETIYKSGTAAVNPDINKLLKSLNEYSSRLKDLRANEGDYARLEKELDECEQERTNLEKAVTVARQHLSEARQLQNAWPVWIEICNAETELHELPSNLDNFPARGVERLREHLAAIEKYTLEFTNQQIDLNKAADELKTVQPDVRVIGSREDIIQLDNQMPLFQKMLKESGDFNIKLDQCSQDIKAKLAALPGWNEEEVLKFNTSVEAMQDWRAAAEALDSTSAELKKADDAMNALHTFSIEDKTDGGISVPRNTQQYIEYVEKQIEEQEKLQQLASSTNLDVSSDVLDDALINHVARIEELNQKMLLYANERANIVQENQLKARLEMDFNRSLTDFKGWNRETVAQFDLSIGAEQIADTHVNNLSAALQSLQNAEVNLKRLKGRLENATSEEADNKRAFDVKWAKVPPDSEALDEKIQAMAAAVPLIANEKRLSEAIVTDKAELVKKQAELQTVKEKSTPTTKTILQFTIGIVLLFVGLLAISVTHGNMKYVGIGILIMVVGGVVAYHSKWRPRASISPTGILESDIQRLESSIAAAENQAKTSGAERERLSKILQCEITDESIETLNSELKNERKRRESFDKERLEMESLARAVRAKKDDYTECEAEFRAAKTTFDQQTQQWKAYLTGLKLDPVTTPEALPRLRSAIREMRNLLDRLNQVELRVKELTASVQRILGDGIELAGMLGLSAPVEESLETFAIRCTTLLSEAQNRKQQAELGSRDIENGAKLLKRLHSELASARAKLERLQTDRAHAFTPASTALGSWQSKLATTPFSLTTGSQEFSSAVEIIKEVKHLHSVRSEYAEKLEANQKAMDSIVGLGAQLAVRLEMNAPEQETLVQFCNQLKERLVSADALATERSQRENELSASRQKLEAVEKRREEELQKLANLLDSAGASTEAEFYNRAELWEKKERLNSIVANGITKLTTLSAPGEAVQILKGKLAGCELSDIEMAIEAADAKVKELQAELQRTNELVGEKNTRMEAIQNSDDIAKLQFEREAVLAEIAPLAEEWAALRIAHELLTVSRQRYEKEHQPAILQNAGRYLSTITHGRYTGILHTDDKKRKPILLGSTGERKTVQWNQGLQDQVMFCLRLGIIEDYSSKEESLPVIFDDVLVNCDADHRDGASRCIAEAAHTHQIFYFTCHMPTVDALRKHSVNCQYMEIEDGMLKLLKAG